jgi:hypothetical protein
MWHFDEGSGDVAEDSSGNGNHGTLMSSPIWVDEGYFGKALEFAGSSSNTHVAIPDSDSLDSVEITVAAWIRPSSLEGTWNVIASKWFNPNGEQDWLFALRRSDPGYKMNLYLTNEFNFFADSEVFPGEWSYCVFTLNDSGDIALYLNGKLDGQKLGTGGKTSSSLSNVQISDHRTNGNGFIGLIDEVVMYNVALSEADINNIMRGTPAGLASDPSPADEATDILRDDAVLTWAPGQFAATHDVYFGENLDDVSNATATVDPAGVYQGRQDVSSYAVAERLDLGETYYWRIDEVNAAPDLAVYGGNVWSFTVEPTGYPIPDEVTTVTASSFNKDEEKPENVINGSGLDEDDLHSADSATMWLSDLMDPNIAWIQFEFDKIYRLYQMLVWNYNTTVEPAVGFGIKEAIIEYSVDGVNWSVLGTTHEFAQGPGETGYANNTAVDFLGVAARYIRITVNSNWSPWGLKQYGLSEVRFLYTPVCAREPSPDSGATDVSVDRILSFRAGREAATHNVYLSTEEQAVIDGTAPVTTMTEPSYASSLDLAATYYWRVDEVNDTETPTSWQGDIWTLSTEEYLVVDDFETYNDIPLGEDGSNLVYIAYKDGVENPSTNGATIGYFAGASMETSVVHDGKQSVPLFYDNTTATYSEVTANIADLQVTQDWTTRGIKALTLRFFGDPTNVLQQMYVKINGVKVPYDGSAEDTRLARWQMWYIDLASIGMNLSNITELTIGFERIGAAGGQGKVFFDAIRLYSYDRQLITPVEPDAAGLQAHYEFEGNTNDSSGNARHGAGTGTSFVPGRIGQAVNLDGLDYVEITGYKGILGSDPFTIAAWINTSDVEGTIVGWGSTPGGTTRVEFRINADRLRCESSGSVQGDTTLPDNEWVHVAVTAKAGAVIDDPDVTLYLDGRDDTRVSTGAQNPLEIAAGYDVTIGRRHSGESRWLIGLIDDVRIYNYELSQEEIVWLAGRTQPFDKPFEH